MKLSVLLKSINLTQTLVHDPEIVKVSSLEKGVEGTISFLANPKYHKLVGTSKASAIFVPLEYTGSSTSILIKCANPSKSLSQAIEVLGINSVSVVREISSKTEIHPTVKIGKNCSIGPFVVIEANVIIGDNTIIEANSFIGASVRVGSDCHFYPSVVIYHHCEIGNRVIVHSHTTLGSDGFGFELEGNSAKIPQVGIVSIADDVEIGANVSIDRARFDATRIGQYTKIDNQVQIGHNVEIGQRCMIVSQVGIAGSSIIGNGVILAGQAGVSGHLKIGDGTMVAAKAGIGNNVAPGSKISGHYGQNHQDVLRQYVALKQLPDMMKKLKKLIKEES